MSDRNFNQLLRAKFAEGKSVCVGLDPVVEKLPDPCKLRHTEYSPTTVRTQFVEFSESIVDSTADLVCAFKPNSAFFEDHGAEGWKALREMIERTHKLAPDISVIIDAKRADIGNTNIGYVHMAFDYLGADAVTVHPYLGQEALEPFLEKSDKGIIVLCRTSNPGSGEFQDLPITLTTGIQKEIEDYLQREVPDSSMPFYQYLAYRVASKWNINNNCGLVVGATYPDELRKVRELVGDMPILIPGIGAQGGDLEATVLAGRDSCGQGMIINSSRGIIYASGGADFRDAARYETERLNSRIAQCLAQEVTA